MSNRWGSVDDPGYFVEYKIVELLLQQCLIFANEFLVSSRKFLVGTPRTGSEVVEVAGKNGECFLGVLGIRLKRMRDWR